MIVARQKPIAEIASFVSHHKRVLLVGCNTCTAVALAGGEKEVETLAELLRLATSRKGTSVDLAGTVLERQCEPEFIDELCSEDFDALLSLGCGAGVALLASTLEIPVYPALDTLFIGSAVGFANWQAECSACGQCVLGRTAGICPITRCAKGILNGPCGGVSDGKCELGDRDCAWVLIYERLEKLGHAEAFAEAMEPKDHSIRTNCPTWDMTTAGKDR